MINTNSTEKPTCPHCGHQERDAWEIDFGPGIEGDTEHTCHSCGEEYHLERWATIYYSSAKKESQP